MKRSRTELGSSQELVWGYPRPSRPEDSEKRVKVVFGRVALAYTDYAERVMQTSRPPVYYVPPEDIRMEHLTLAGGTSFCAWKGVADLSTGERTEQQTAWFYRELVSANDHLKDYVAFYPFLVDACWVGEEKVHALEGDFCGSWTTSDIVDTFEDSPGIWGW